MSDDQLTNPGSYAFRERRSWRDAWLTSASLVRKLYIYVLIAAVLGFLVWLLLASPSSTVAGLRPRLSEEVVVISECVERFAPRFRNQNSSNSADIGSAFQLCYSLISSSLLAEEQENRNDNLVLQRSENVVILWMVVAITISGVALAGLQLLASFQLAKIGKGELASGGKIRVEKNSVVVQSSVIGVIILSISFAFFMVYVIYVYKIVEIRPDSQTSAAISNVPGNSNNVGHVQKELPVLPKLPEAVGSKGE